MLLDMGDIHTANLHPFSQFDNRTVHENVCFQHTDHVLEGLSSVNCPFFHQVLQDLYNRVFNMIRCIHFCSPLAMYVS